MTAAVQIATPALAHERTYVGSVLARATLMDSHRVDPASLSHEPYRVALSAIVKLRLADERVTPTSLRMELERGGWRTPEDLVTHLRETPVDLDLEPIAKRLRELARLRDYRSNAALMIQLVEQGNLEACREVAGRMTLVHDAGAVEQPVVTYGEMWDMAEEAIFREGTEQRIFIPLGMSPIDDAFKLSPGSTLVVGAQTGIGKSSLLHTWMMNVSETGIPVGLVSVEDPVEDFGAKSIGAATGINPSLMWAGGLTTEHKTRIANAKRENRLRPYSFAFVKSRDLDDVLARIEFMVRVRGARLIGLDYLQAVRHRPGKDIRERIDMSLEEIIALCGRLNVALILLSQMSRNEKGNPFKEPHVNDLKESGSIENRAQGIVLLWKDSDKAGTPTHAKLAKVKRGPGGRRWKLARHPKTGMLVDLATIPVHSPMPERDDENEVPDDMRDERGF